ncbi:MFS transporter [Rouxiella badensis]|jgi:EmrB/QacA subfamily drug resistance transporter|uniref:MFS transporter n=1 Tax=Rouxiella badensis TaxID=1646377 RepID=UPI0013EF266E|nr:MFS transporter [Rouxiella badensis]QII39104.1 MFS transporter [Rouxiella badensis]WAT10632.1 MFS transporter [Rouxiella badensis]
MAVSPTTKNRLALTAVCLAAMMSGLEISSVPVILPILEKQIGASFAQLQWIMNAYTLACTTVLMATGTLADRFGRKRLFLISIIGFGVTSLMCGVAQTASVMIVGRFLQGLSGGAMLICLIAILSSQFTEGKARSRAFTAWGMVFGFGLGFGPMIGGIIVTQASWQWVFLVHVFIAMLTWLLARSNVLESRDTEDKKLDVGGLVTLSLTVLGATFYITQGGQMGYSSLNALSILGGALLCAIIFVIIERRHPHPMFDFSVFKNRSFFGALLGSAGMNFSFWPFMIYLPLYYQSVLGFDIISAGGYLLAYTLPTLLMPPVAARLVHRFGAARIIPAGLFGIGIGFLLMRVGISQAFGLLPGALLAGAALGLTNTPVTHTTTGSLPVSRAGMASGMDMSARLITLAINIAVMGSLLVAGIGHYLRDKLPARLDAAHWQTLAERIAGGEQLAGAPDTPFVSTALAREALTAGFSNVLLYGALGVSLLALASHLVFASRSRTPICVAPSKL